MPPTDPPWAAAVAAVAADAASAAAEAAAGAGGTEAAAAAGRQGAAAAVGRQAVAAVARQGPTGAADLAAVVAQVRLLGAALDAGFLLLMGVMVLTMQTGFAMLTAGSVRAKNVKSVLMKVLMDTCVGGLAWTLFGYVCWEMGRRGTGGGHGRGGAARRLDRPGFGDPVRASFAGGRN